MKLFFFAATLSVAPLCQVSKSLALSSQPSAKHQSDAPSSPSNRVFVAGIPASCTEETIRSALSRFGTVDDVKIVGQNDDTAKKRQKRNPYCFVTFDDASAARRAVDAPTPTLRSSDDGHPSLYKEIKYATPITSRRRSNQSRAREAGELSRIEALGAEANLIVQVQSSHLDRTVAYLDRAKAGGGGLRAVLGSVRTNSKNVSLLLLSCDDPTGASRGLYADPALARAMNKSYVVRPRLVEGNLSTEQGCIDLARMLCDNIQTLNVSKENDDEEPIVCRMQVFPPKHQGRLVKSIGNIVDAQCTVDASKRQFTISQRGFSHMLSVVEVYRYRGRDWKTHLKDENVNLYMAGISPASSELDVVDTNNIIAEDSDDGDDVSRAYYKLKEAVERYEDGHGELRRSLHGSIALDCGSAPGGWTKFLIERFGCERVCSVDPGELAPSVLRLKGTRHMRMKIQDALPRLLEDDATSGKVKIWVSDMCLHNMESQGDLLLHARERGVLASGAFFVLTLKCIVGHSKSSYDAQVEKVVEKLCRDADVSDVETYHLFSNRSGERTVMGYLNK